MRGPGKALASGGNCLWGRVHVCEWMGTCCVHVSVHVCEGLEYLSRSQSVSTVPNTCGEKALPSQKKKKKSREAWDEGKDGGPQGTQVGRM